MNCLVCGIEFEPKRADAKTCSRNCRVTLSRKGANVTDNVTLSDPNVTLSDPNVTLNFKFYVINKPSEIRTAKYWYDVPLAAIPVLQEGWPEVPIFPAVDNQPETTMNGRQYFLWWKNEFKENEAGPVIHNPFPVRDKVTYDMGGETAKKWGAH